ncbi:Zn(II)2Cys6 transcription factor domain-containing protein [Aspergillus clavatus NRRL 1]|uniref:C6 zinc finger domain protein n=1 Tax=Aspergillus clavatus (strain ATCC 1007 / CBS 513.65 / DSM 816 / NCTC 3887 / NRRL 1 / QM 1276 / 107) TaxID=344612 RepID=A1CMT7_ASPCL|nr:C6 zinc finger domain protein [Aspergillus clavatus NRRL 1]EAW08874.1 C6 zinc finger domain protein [Aspergillus clavatus NRRL 1]
MSTNPHDYSDPNRQGQYPPPQWNSSQPEDSPAAPQYPPASQYPYPPASYPPPTADHHQYPPPPPPSQYPPPSSMAAIHPHVQGPQDPYRLPPPPGAYRPPDVYAQQAPPPQPQVVYQAAAPRQRTAIACRYCRRRKIRCSGFESSQDGRCSNCIRFNQECMFTPVSSQAQAFVPAHAAYPHLRNPQNQGRGGPPVMLYGAHGQPLPPQQQPQPPVEATLPPPQGMYQHPYGSAPPPLASTMPADHRPAGRRGSGSGFEYPDPTNLAPVTPATSTAYQPHTAPSPYYPPQQHDRRPSPQSAYPYDNRHSSSPHSSPYPPIHPAQSAMTPPPTSTPGSSSRGGLNVRDMLNPGDSQGRSSTDSDMLNALNRRGLNQ